jgi:hypothetical protein
MTGYTGLRGEQIHLPLSRMVTDTTREPEEIIRHDWHSVFQSQLQSRYLIVTVQFHDTLQIVSVTYVGREDGTETSIRKDVEGIAGNNLRYRGFQYMCGEIVGNHDTFCQDSRPTAQELKSLYPWHEGTRPLIAESRRDFG